MTVYDVADLLITTLVVVLLVTATPAGRKMRTAIGAGGLGAAAVAAPVVGVIVSGAASAALIVWALVAAVAALDPAAPPRRSLPPRNARGRFIARDDRLRVMADRATRNVVANADRFHRKPYLRCGCGACAGTKVVDVARPAGSGTPPGEAVRVLMASGVPTDRAKELVAKSYGLTPDDDDPDPVAPDLSTPPSSSDIAATTVLARPDWWEVTVPNAGTWAITRKAAGTAREAAELVVTQLRDPASSVRAVSDLLARTESVRELMAPPPVPWADRLAGFAAEQEASAAALRAAAEGSSLAGFVEGAAAACDRSAVVYRAEAERAAAWDVVRRADPTT